MKKLLILALSLIIVFAFTACDQGDVCEIHLDENNDGVCDMCGGDATCRHSDSNADGKCDDCGIEVTEEDGEFVPLAPGHKPGNNNGNGNNGNDAAVQGAVLADAVIKQLEAAASMKIEFEFNMIGNQTEWFYSYDDNGENPVPDSDSDFIEGTAKASIVISKSGENVNAKIDINVVSREDENEELELVADYTALYLVNGELYVYDDGLGVYFKEQLPNMDTDATSDMLNSIFNGIEFEAPTAEEIEQMKEAIGNFVITTFNLKNGKGEFTVDVKPTADAILNYVEALDLNTKTAEALLNDILAIVDENLKVADIVNALEEAAGLTVNEALVEVDKYLTENYETTLQGIYYDIVTDPSVITLITNVLTMRGVTPEQLFNTLQSIKALDVYDLVEQSGMGNMTLTEVINDMFMANKEQIEHYHFDENSDGYCDSCYEYIEENEVPEVPAEPEFDPEAAIADTFGTVRALLAMTLADIENNVFEFPVFTQIKAMLAGIQINEAKSTLEIHLQNGSFNIISIDLNSKLDFVASIPSGIPDKNDTFDYTAEVKVKIHNLSAKEQNITLPDDKTLYNYKIYGEFYPNQYEFSDLYVDKYFDRDEFYLDLYYQDYELGEVFLHVDGLTAEDLFTKGSTITFSDEDIKVSYNYGYEEIVLDSTGDLVINFNLADSTFIVTQIPEIVYPEINE